MLDSVQFVNGMTIMVGHLAERMYRPVEALPHVPEDLQEPEPISIGQKNVLATVSPGGDVV